MEKMAVAKLVKIWILRIGRAAGRQSLEVKFTRQAFDLFSSSIRRLQDTQIRENHQKRI